MRTTLIALLASASIVSAGGCARSSIEDLVADTSCGSIDVITDCLGAADLQRLDEIERCYSSSGCGVGEATVEAVWFAKDCQPLDNGRGDLRKRADSTDSDSTTEKTTAKTTSTKSTTAKSTVASTSATTTSDSSTTDSTSSTATTASSTTSSSSTSTSTGSTTAATTTGTAACSVTSTKTTKVCQTTSGTSTCSSTTTGIASCAPGLICFTATAGADICMKRDNSLTSSGLVVTIVFGFALAATAIIFIIMCVRNSAKAKQEQRAQLLATASSKGNDVEAQAFPNRSEANLPLITPGGTRSEQTEYYGANQPQQDYFGQSGSGNSVTPPANRGGAPQLHPGLSALGGESRL